MVAVSSPGAHGASISAPSRADPDVCPASALYYVRTIDQGQLMETQTRADVAAPHERQRHGLLWGLLAGLVPNAVIFIALFATSLPDERIHDWLAVGILYAGPVVVGLAGLVQMTSRPTRRRGVGLILAALITVAMWFVASALATSIAVGANTAGG